MILRRLFNYGQENLRGWKTRTAVNDILVRFLPSPLPLPPSAQPLLDELRQAGNVPLPSLVPIEILRSLREQLSVMPCFDPWSPDKADFPVDQADIEVNNARIRNTRDLPVAKQIANHPLVLSIVSQYLGCRPTIDDILAWWSLPGRPAPKEEQFFHRDNDAIRFVKLFLYLSEVGERDGAHMFVRGSQADGKLAQKRKRYQDEEVISAFGQDAISPIVGQFGQAFLEDTFGLHKGSVPSDHPRLLLQVRYTSFPSVFARRGINRHPDSGLDPYVNRYVA